MPKFVPWRSVPCFGTHVGEARQWRVNPPEAGEGLPPPDDVRPAVAGGDKRRPYKTLSDFIAESNGPSGIFPTWLFQITKFSTFISILQSGFYEHVVCQ
jgi:hypothetical protein